MIDQDSTSEVPRIKIAPFNAESLKLEQPGEYARYIHSNVFSIGPHSHIQLTGARYLTEAFITQEFEEDDVAITIDSEGNKQEANARELLRNGGYVLDASFFSAFDFDDVQELIVNLSTANGIPLVTSEFVELGEDGPTELEVRILQRLGSHFKPYTSVLSSVEPNPESSSEYIVKPVIVQKEQLRSLRVDIGLGGDI